MNAAYISPKENDWGRSSKFSEEFFSMLKINSISETQVRIVMFLMILEETANNNHLKRLMKIKMSL